MDGVDTALLVDVLLRTRNRERVVDTLITKLVLIGGFAPELEAVPAALRTVLVARDLLPVVVHLRGLGGRDMVGTVRTLAYLSRFLIADLTDMWRAAGDDRAVVRAPRVGLAFVQHLLQRVQHEVDPPRGMRASRAGVGSPTFAGAGTRLGSGRASAAMSRSVALLRATQQRPQRQPCMPRPTSRESVRTTFWLDHHLPV